MGQGEITAQTFLTIDGVGLTDLATGDSTSVGDVLPWCINLTTLATVKGGTKTDVLGGQGDGNSAVGRNAQTIGRGFGTGKGPAATAPGRKGGKGGKEKKREKNRGEVR